MMGGTVTRYGSRSDPTGDRVISALSRDAANELLRRELSRLSDEERLIVAARSIGVPLIVLASRFGGTERMVRLTERYALLRLRYPVVSYRYVEEGALKEALGEGAANVFSEIVSKDSALITLIEEHSTKRTGICKVCKASIQGPVAGRRREYCSNRCRQRAYRTRVGGQPKLGVP
jgi:hypothetical protein